MTVYAYYDLAVSPASFDVMAFLAIAKDWADAQGEPLHVVIVPGRYDGFRADHKPISVAEKIFRLQHVLLPMCHAIGASATICADRAQAKLFPSTEAFPQGYLVDRPVAHYDTGAIIAHGKRIGRSPAAFMPSAQALALVDSSLKEMFGASARPVVITLRETYVDVRNSDVAAWVAFAKRLQADGQPVIILRDTDAAATPCDPNLPHFPMAAIDLDLRLALYERAFVNMGVCGGPPFLNAFSARRPYLLFKMLVEGWNSNSAEYLTQIGLPPGAQMPWAGPHQRIVWNDDSLDNLVAAYESFCATVSPDAPAVEAKPQPLPSARLPMMQTLHAPAELTPDMPWARVISGGGLMTFLDAVKNFLKAFGGKTVLDYGCGRAVIYRLRDIPSGNGQTYPTVEDYWGVQNISLYEPAYPPYGTPPDGQRDVVLAINLLERTPEAELDGLLADIFSRARRAVFFTIAAYGPPLLLPDGLNLVCTERSGSWWREKIAAAAAAWQDRRWALIYLSEDPAAAAQARRMPIHEKYEG